MLDEATEYLENRQVSAQPLVGSDELNHIITYIIVSEKFESENESW